VTSISSATFELPARALCLLCEETIP
jgi:hypothetical protein